MFRRVVDAWKKDWALLMAMLEEREAIKESLKAGTVAGRKRPTLAEIKEDMLQATKGMVRVGPHGARGRIWKNIAADTINEDRGNVIKATGKSKLRISKIRVIRANGDVEVIKDDGSPN